MPAQLDYLDCGAKNITVTSTLGFQTFTIPFNFTFANVPVIAVSINDGGHISGYNYWCIFVVNNITASQFNLVLETAGSSFTGGTYTVNWIAMDPKASRKLDYIDSGIFNGSVNPLQAGVQSFSSTI